jgi:hypothetical protein
LACIRSRRSGRRWLISLIKKMWDIAWDFWSHRNGVAHQKAQQLNSSDQLQLDHSVNQVYQDLLQGTRSRIICKLLFLPLQNILSKDARYKTVWLCQAITALQRTRLGARRSLLQMKRCMEAWLRRTRNTSTST